MFEQRQSGRDFLFVRMRELFSNFTPGISYPVFCSPGGRAPASSALKCLA